MLLWLWPLGKGRQLLQGLAVRRTKLHTPAGMAVLAKPAWVDLWAKW